MLKTCNADWIVHQALHLNKIVFAKLLVVTFYLAHQGRYKVRGMRAIPVSTSVSLDGTLVSLNSASVSLMLALVACG